METPVSARLTKGEGRRFAFSVGGAFLALAGLLLWRSALVWPIPAVLGASLAVAGLVIPDRLGAVHRAWMAGAMAISRITTPIVLALLYFGVITPIGVLGRLFGRNHIVRRPIADSFWVSLPPEARRSDLNRQF